MHARGKTPLGELLVELLFNPFEQLARVQEMQALGLMKHKTLWKTGTGKW